MRLNPICRRIVVNGLVQGVGFRPFVYRLATALKLVGSVQNTASGVVIEIEGDPDSLEEFLQRLGSDLPAPGSIQSLQQQNIAINESEIRNSSQFEILPSQRSASQTAQLLSATTQILPDLSICSDCLQDIVSPQNRRYRYPFTNCTQCGPRFSIIQSLPYDRDRTTMAKFAMCPACYEEYNNPEQRRFHAQPNACEQCGPALSFWQVGKCHHEQPLESALAVLKQGGVLALKGLGGFQLLTNACDATAVARLRERKGRPDKPLALMCPSLESVRRYCEVSEAAAALLSSPQGPIVLLPKRPQHIYEQSLLAYNIAPGNASLGVMLPTTPLHHLLLQAYGTPLVATSGNLSGEPICTDEQAACWRLVTIADAFLSHNRPIQRPVDDSVVQLVRSQPQVLRLARGYAPKHSLFSNSLSTNAPSTEYPCVLALGAQLKSAIAVSTGDEIMLSQHIGDLSTPGAIAQLKKTVRDFLSLYRIKPDVIACDQHPDYASTQLAHAIAQEREIPLIPVQHHYAHILACMAEHQLQGPVLGIAWDGTGYGTDQTVWGGEFLQTTDTAFDRVAHFLPYFLPGGDRCAQEPRRSALGLLYSCYGEAAFEMTDLAPMQAFKAPQLVILRKMLTNKINTPVTSSVGRLFDGVASLLNLHQITSFEGQAAMTLESAAYQSPVKRIYPFTLSDSTPSLVDWRPMVKAIVEDTRNGVMTPVIAAKFHNTMTEIIVEVAQRSGLTQVVLAGGCFQNTRLLEQTIRRLSAEGLTSYWPQQIPPNDGGLAVGQVMAAWRQLSHASSSSTSHVAKGLAKNLASIGGT
ncbi:MAG: carbamoyltransferase HypF [Cyanobacteria bacterium J06635_11]